VEARNGAEAVELPAAAPDAVLLDILMPMMMVRSVRAIQALPGGDRVRC
jgi:CheY-like chemotaxis protein